MSNNSDCNFVSAASPTKYSILAAPKTGVTQGPPSSKGFGSSFSSVGQHLRKVDPLNRSSFWKVSPEATCAHSSTTAHIQYHASSVRRQTHNERRSLLVIQTLENSVHPPPLRQSRPPQPHPTIDFRSHTREMAVCRKKETSNPRVKQKHPDEDKE